MVAVRRGLFYAFLTLFMLEVLKRSFTEAMLVMTLPMLANSMAQPTIWGPLSDKIGKRKPFIVIGETIAGIFYILLSPYAWSLFTGQDILKVPSLYSYFLIVGLTILESIWSMSNVAWSALLADLTTKDTRGIVVGQLYSVGAVGRIFGVFLGGLLYDYPTKAAGFPYLFYISAIIMFGSAMIILVAIDEKTEVALRTRKEKKFVHVNFENKKIFYVFLLAIALTTIGSASIFRILNYYLRLALLATSLEMSIISNVSSITQLFANPIIGRISDKRGRVPVLEIGFSLSILVPILYTIPRQIIWLIPVSILVGINRVILTGIAYSYIADIVPEVARGRYLGQYNMIRTLSFGVIPILTAGILPDIWKKSLVSIGYTSSEAEILIMTYIFYLASFLALLGFMIFELHKRIKT